MSDPGQGSYEALTEREQEILLCLAEGLSNQEIANRLYLAENTVRWYNSQIYSKLGVNNRSSAVEQAQTLDLLDQPDVAIVESKHNLPGQATPFIGRHQELADLDRLIADATTRLVTILAPGGMGKTRLALALAERQLRRFDDGVFFVPLASLTSPDLIAATVAEQMGLSLYGSEALDQQLIDYLRDRNTLLILDNFEHLLEGAPLVTALIRAAPAVRVLATSREKLNLSGETVFSLSGLHFPTWETPEDALEYDAVKLFMQSAHRARPDFELQADDLDYLARICRLTAGMPLGLVLAAGWLDVLSLEQIAAELRQGIDILETEQRDVPERQRSVRATFNYSWARLTELEQRVFAKLSVFRGGFTAEAAQAVAGASTRALRRLVSKALVQALPTGRYEVHELLRQFAEEHLMEAGDMEVVFDIHCHHYLDFLRRCEPDMKGRKQIETLGAINADLENIYAAWRWGVAHNQAEAISQAVETLSVYVHAHTTHQFDAELLFRQAREKFSEETQPRAWARVTLRHVFLLHHGILWSENAFRDDIERCMAIAEEHDDLGEVAFGKKLLALHNWTTRRYEPEVKQLMREVLTIYEALDEPYFVSNALKWMGILSADKNTALEYYDKSLAVAREAGIPTQVLLTLENVAFLYLQQGRYAEAAAAFGETITLSTALDDLKLLSAAQFRLSVVKFLTGKFTEARELADEAIRIDERLGYGLAEYITLTTSALFSTLDQDAASQSQQWFEEALADVSKFPELAVAVMSGKILRTYAQEDHPTAWRDAMQCLRESTRVSFIPFRLAALAVIAMLLADDGEQVRAVELLSLALNHPVSPRGWLENVPLLTRKREQLQAQLDAEAYTAACERGKSLDLETVVEELLAEVADAEGK